MSKSSAKPSTAPVRIGRSPVTGVYILAPYPKKGGMDPKKIRAVVEAMVAGAKD